MHIVPYLMFAGEAEAALHFYQRVLGGEITMLSRYGDNPDMGAKGAQKEKILHARLESADFRLYFSDSMPNVEVETGNKVSMNIECTSMEEINEAYALLSEGAKVEYELQDTFWGARYAKLTDRFGLRWDLNYQYPQEGK